MLAKTLRARPNEVEAIRFTGSKPNAMEVVSWVREHGGSARYAFERVELQLEDGVKYVGDGYWITFDKENGFKVLSDKTKKYRYEEVSA